MTEHRPMAADLEFESAPPAAEPLESLRPGVPLGSAAASDQPVPEDSPRTSDSSPSPIALNPQDSSAEHLIGSSAAVVGEIDAKFARLLQEVHHNRPGDDLEIIRKAWAFCLEQHEGQKRASGEPYAVHPLEVGLVLAELKMDSTAIAAGLLHDAVEDTNVTTEQIEDLFGRLDLVAYALFAVGLLILWAGLRERGAQRATTTAYDRSVSRSGDNVTFSQSGWMGAIQGLSLPFRGFSRSGSTISAGLLAGANRERAERFSFALAVILTPAVVAREGMRLVKASHEATAAGTPLDLHGSIVAALVGMVLSFVAGLAALRWLSSWLESGRWYLFGLYCLAASVAVFYLHHIGY